MPASACLETWMYISVVLPPAAQATAGIRCTGSCDAVGKIPSSFHKTGFIIAMLKKIKAPLQCALPLPVGFAGEAKNLLQAFNSCRYISRCFLLSAVERPLALLLCRAKSTRVNSTCS